MSKGLKVIIAIGVAVLIIVGVLALWMNVFTGITIGSARPMNSGDQYLENIAHWLVGPASSQNTEQMHEASDFCDKFQQEFKKEHSDDKYHVEVDAEVKKGKTIITYHGTITDAQTGVTEDYENNIEFDFVYSRNIEC